MQEQGHILNQNLREFLTKNFKTSSGPFKWLLGFYGTENTLEDLLRTEGWELLEARNLGIKGYIRICEELKARGFTDEQPIFKQYEEAKGQVA